MKIVTDRWRFPIPTELAPIPVAECPVDPDCTVPVGSECAADAATRDVPDPTGDELIAAGDLLRALAAPVRISIVLALMRSEQCVHQLVSELGVTQPLVSQHLRVLKTAGVVKGERNGREITYRLVDAHLAHIVLDAVAHASEHS
ncbi:metalloregulator ArsR/SmtB family transcription factor [Tsukamurella sp. 8F]|uniref:ArsR/SmtB family transcription factor n=1 Tax=unclassified Tsukamurella TaxID=2633480 RepID=UPI0023B98703|nr:MULTISPECIES: metalloregulator ArsR/SmtB family transcription factor [unclassified Tsukamurella]MDF0529998.1 metalloregulator ArsR/SmtB family transcription factor [Tsukamurella sp. 8J]MDF0587230.1 metalloregulator ArsR/SmtB family transcription factor [Tsukamurella sp. 8F]